MATVFFLEATSESHSLVYRRYLAAKTFNSESDRRQIRGELENWSRLSHPNVLPLNAIGSLDDELAAVSPWRQDGSLAHMLKGKQLPLRVAKEAILDTALALDYAFHAHRMLHLDIKPQNILHAGTLHRFELADWGISSILSGRDLFFAKQGKNISGTIPYMAPERFSNNQIDTAADIFSLGIVAIEMITAGLPFQNYDQRLVHEITSGEYLQTVDRLVRVLPTDWRRLVQSMTAFSPRKRPARYKSLITTIQSLSE